MMPAPVNTATGQASPNATPRQQLVAARAQLAALLQTKKPDHPDVGRAQRTITELEARVAKEPPDSENAAVTGDTVNEQQRRDRLQQWRAEIESLDRQIKFKENEENNLRKRVSDYQGRIEAVPSTESEWMQLTRDYDTLQTAYKGLLAKSEESKVAADLERRQIGEQFRARSPSWSKARQRERIGHMLVRVPYQSRFRKNRQTGHPPRHNWMEARIAISPGLKTPSTSRH
jgi:chromosome segregation ATPase